MISKSDKIEIFFPNDPDGLYHVKGEVEEVTNSYVVIRVVTPSGQRFQLVPFQAILSITWNDTAPPF